MKEADGSIRPVEAVPLPLTVDEQMQSWDCSFKDLETSDYLGGPVWARLGADRFLLNQVRDRMDCPRTVQAVRDRSRIHCYAHAKLIEDKANESAIVQMLQRKIPRIIPVNLEGGNVARATM